MIHLSESIQMTRQDLAEKTGVTAILFETIQCVLETYSNVHRGSGHKSMVTTHLYEKARGIVLEYLGLKKSKYAVIFLTPARAEAFTKLISHDDYQIVSSKDFGLPLGVSAVAVKKKALPKGIPFQTGGGTTKLYSKNWVIWANGPDKFEAGTPSIINIIAFARALLLIREQGKDIFKSNIPGKISVDEIFYDDELKDLQGKDLLENLQRTMIGNGLQVPTSNGLKPFINLDNSASTSTFEAVWDAFKDAFGVDEKKQKEIIAEVKKICAKVLSAPLNEYDIIFTSNTTESINNVAQSLKPRTVDLAEPVILNTILEHSSNDLPWRMVDGHSVIRLEVNKEGFWDLDELGRILASYNRDHQFGEKRIRLVAASGASNVLGVCNDLEALSRVVHSYSAELLVDGAQLVAHRQVVMATSGIDYLAFSAHKIYAPFGCGVLIAKKGLLNADMIETAVKSGEENVGGIAALGKSLLLLKRIGFDTIHCHEQTLTRHALEGMKKIPGMTVQGILDTDSPKFEHKIGVILFGIKDMMAGSIAGRLARNRGIGVRYGCHCAHLIIKYLSNFTPATERIQKAVVLMVPALKLQGFVRVSFGLENTVADVDALLQELESIARKEKKPGKKVEVKAKIREFITLAEQRVYDP
jgi:selenocysteine lyase/cysteine desulfurase